MVRCIYNVTYPYSCNNYHCNNNNQYCHFVDGSYYQVLYSLYIYSHTGKTLALATGLDSMDLSTGWIV